MPVDGVALQETAGYGAEDTEEHVLTLMVSPMMSSRDELWRAMLSCLSRRVEKTGFKVTSMRLIPANKVGQACGKVRLLRLPA